ncbi:MAG TPA: tetratricopeptide repeat protein [Candidatus Limnocylindrales bacterium]|nr:tetratricopeptide repeat protein [Candidatus Limnocylindrales bacterium]
MTSRSPRRTRIRPLGLLAAAGLVVAGSYALTALRPIAPFTSPVHSGRDDAFAPAAVADPAGPSDLAAIDAQIAVWGPKAAADPRDDISAGNLGVLYLGRGRLTGDADDYEKALTAAERAVAANPVSTGTRALKATILQATHDFTGALALAESIVREEPRNVDALAVVGDAQLELGRLDDAAATYGAIATIQTGPALDAREARLAWLRGDSRGAIRLATAARDGAARDGSSDPSFYEAQLGEMARLTGDATAARTAFDAALAIRPSNQLALLGSARLAAAAGDDASAIATLNRAAAIAPRPETLALLSDLLARDGDPKGAAAQTATIRAIEQLGGASAKLFDRQLLAFELDHGGATPAILVKAEAAAAIRPDAAGLDVVAWAAYRLGDIRDAAAESADALESGTVDARILYHAGAIAIADGRETDGRALVRRSLDLGPALDPLDRTSAESLLDR